MLESRSSLLYIPFPSFLPCTSTGDPFRRFQTTRSQTLLPSSSELIHAPRINASLFPPHTTPAQLGPPPRASSAAPRQRRSPPTIAIASALSTRQETPLLRRRGGIECRTSFLPGSLCRRGRRLGAGGCG
jgi:hypothetical protein